MVLINKEIIEATVSNLILSIRNHDWTEGREYFHLQSDLEDSIKECLSNHNIHIKGEIK